MNKSPGLKKGQTLKSMIYYDSLFSIEFDRCSYILKTNSRSPRYYSNLSSLFTSILDIKMKKSLSISSLDIPVKRFKEITDQAVSEIQSIASEIRFSLSNKF